MAVQNNTIKTRIQLKNDTEANWIKAVNFIPKQGEVIIYSAETNSDELPAGRTIPHPFSRLKVGDGVTTVTNLPFIDSGTLNGTEVELVKCSDSDHFPISGSNDKLYVDLATSRIYHYAPGSGYTPLSNFNFSIDRSTIGSVTGWVPGSAATATIKDNIFQFKSGTQPKLSWENRSVVVNITKEES